MKGQRKQSGFSIVEAVLIVAAIGIIGAAGWVVYQHNRPKTTDAATGNTQTTNQNANQQPTNNPPAQTATTYTSNQEKASFQYPAGWTVSTPAITSNDTKNTDQTTIVSPSGAIKISYVTDLTGFGNEYGSSYPYNTVIDKAAISNAPGLYVVSGTTTLDGTTYYPWIAVQDSKGILTSGVGGTLATFTSRHALNTSTNKPTGILFATCGARTTQNSPALTQDKANAWFSSTEAQQAKQILLSFSDPQ
ncbi:MAG TPA: hypothetical protein VHC98_02880 [Candidatus Saccharimonadales bacterium]|nr:hypothetical protein [Candidatus Saccharimonadales bacterium]